MKQALELAGVSGLSAAVVMANTMTRAANMRTLEIGSTKDLGYMTIRIIGDVDTVNAAVNTGRQIGTANEKLALWRVIPRPFDCVNQTFYCPKPSVPPSPPRREAQEKTEVEVEIRAETMEAVRAGEPEETEPEEIMPEDTEQETEAESAEAGPEPKTETEPIGIKSEPLVGAKPTRTGTAGPAEPEVPDSPETPSERPKEMAKRTTSAKSTSTTRHKKN